MNVLIVWLIVWLIEVVILGCDIKYHLIDTWILQKLPGKRKRGEEGESTKIRLSGQSTHVQV